MDRGGGVVGLWFSAGFRFTVGIEALGFRALGIKSRNLLECPFPEGKSPKFVTDRSVPQIRTINRMEVFWEETDGT